MLLEAEIDLARVLRAQRLAFRNRRSLVREHLHQLRELRRRVAGAEYDACAEALYTQCGQRVRILAIE